jgi:hypothetical protein
LLSNSQSESAAIKREIERLNNAAAEQAMRRSQFAQRGAENDVKDPENQARFIEQSTIFTKRVLNREEAAIFDHCLAVIREFRARYRCKLNVCPQVSMGEVLGTPEDKSGNTTFSSFNAKRIDILICDDSWRPLVAIEHQGSGHTLSQNSEKRDRIKARALERAELLLIETGPEHCARSPKEFQAELKTKLIKAIEITTSVPP